jgi:hypothetical protein
LSGVVEDARKNFERTRSTHSCRTHKDFCTFSKNARFCDEGVPGQAVEEEGKARGRGMTSQSMTFAVFGTVRGNAKKRVNERAKKSKGVGASQRSAASDEHGYSDGDDEDTKDLKRHFKFSIYKAYWDEVRKKMKN